VRREPLVTPTAHGKRGGTGDAPSTRRARAPLPDGFRHLEAHLTGPAQHALLDAVAAALRSAPFYRPVMPRTGRAFSVLMTNLGALGWVSDRDGYRYQSVHPETGHAWPPMPAALQALWFEVTGYDAPPEVCLVNRYRDGSRMGLHVDADEQALDAPVVSISLGDDALFRIGGPARRGPTRSLWLRSGDVVVLAGASRHCYHGVDRTVPGSARLLTEHAAFDGGGRVNLTLRRVHRP